MKVSLPIIYPITDTALADIGHADQVRAFAQAACPFVQIRDKYAAGGELYTAVADAVRLAHSAGVKVIVNDRVDVALAAGADGVHLGQTDLPPKQAREILGPDSIIGFSTHNIEQAAEALLSPIDYLAIGPVFSTSTKDDAEPVVGLETVRRVKQMCGDIPLVAIGGITAENACDVITAGADSVAMISTLYSTINRSERSRINAISVRYTELTAMLDGVKHL